MAASPTPTIAVDDLRKQVQVELEKARAVGVTEVQARRATERAIASVFRG